MGRPPLSRLRRRFAPLRGTQRRCAALRAAPPGRYAPRALRAQAFCKHEKNALEKRYRTCTPMRGKFHPQCPRLQINYSTLLYPKFPHSPPGVVLLRISPVGRRDTADVFVREPRDET